MGGIRLVECDGAFRAKRRFGDTNADQMIVVVGDSTIGDGLAPEHAMKIIDNGWENGSITHRCPSGRKNFRFVGRR